MTTGARTPEATAEPDSVLAAAIDLARDAVLEVAGDEVGEHLGCRAEVDVAPDGGVVATHAFAASRPGYVGWYWAVTVARATDSDVVTIDEVVLLPGEGALRAPTWIPWHERLRPGDLAPGDLVPPPDEDDPRLVPGYVLSDDPQVEEVAFELGLGRKRVMSREGRLLAAERWYDGDRGPDSAMARQAPAHCGTCGFYLPIGGSLSAGFGVCGNDITDTDGQVVSAEFGCGAHSEAQVRLSPVAEAAEVVFDDGEEFV